MSFNFTLLLKSVFWFLLLIIAVTASEQNIICPEIVKLKGLPEYISLLPKEIFALFKIFKVRHSITFFIIVPTNHREYFDYLTKYLKMVHENGKIICHSPEEIIQHLWIIMRLIISKVKWSIEFLIFLQKLYFWSLRNNIEYTKTMVLFLCACYKISIHDIILNNIDVKHVNTSEKK